MRYQHILCHIADKLYLQTLATHDQVCQSLIENVYKCIYIYILIYIATVHIMAR